LPRNLSTKRRSADLSVGELASRTGVAVSALHYYESLGLIRSWRTAANHRRYDRAMLRHVSIIKVAQKLGVPLAEIGEALQALPLDRTPDTHDWKAMSERWGASLTERIDKLVWLRDKLDYCIGCGCLSVKHCPLYNADDHLGAEGPGPRRLDPDPQG